MNFIEDAEKRSRVKILCNREELYHLSGMSKTAESVLAMSLRLYTGLFTDFVYISETELASQLHISSNDVYQAMLELDKRKIIHYIPRSGLPMLHLPTAREETHTLIIGRDIYEARKRAMEKRTGAVIDYAFNNKNCRVNRMLKYFGEHESCDCGKCDVCREKKRSRKNIQNASEVSLEKVLDFIRAHATGTSLTAIEAQCGADKKITASSLTYLCNEGIVEFREGLYFLTK